MFMKVRQCYHFVVQNSMGHWFARCVVQILADDLDVCLLPHLVSTHHAKSDMTSAMIKQRMKESNGLKYGRINSVVFDSSYCPRDYYLWN